MLLVNQQRIPQSSYIQSLSAIDGPMEHESAQGDEGEGEGGEDDSGDLLEQNDGCAGTDDGRGPAVQTADPGYAQAVAAELQQTVRYWSDFLKVHIHPRSLHTLERVNRCDSFDCYAAGTEAFKSDLAVDEAVDACRRFLEVLFAATAYRRHSACVCYFADASSYCHLVTFVVHVELSS